jgi:hypothetical protein
MARGGRGRSRGGPDYMDMIDIQIQGIPEMFTISNGMLTMSGSEIMFYGKSDSFTFEQSQSVTQINLTIAGQKVQSKGNCCHLLTFGFGSLLIFPLLFMCCQWWKNIVHPKYALDDRTFEQIINLIKKCPGATFLNLTIYDNNLSKQKL